MGWINDIFGNLSKQQQVPTPPPKQATLQYSGMGFKDWVAPDIDPTSDGKVDRIIGFVLFGGFAGYMGIRSLIKVSQGRGAAFSADYHDRAFRVMKVTKMTWDNFQGMWEKILTKQLGSKGVFVSRAIDQGLDHIMNWWDTIGTLFDRVRR